MEDFADEAFLAALSELVRSLEGDAKLNATGAEIFTQMLVKLLSNHLALELAWQRHPEIAEQTIRRPVYIVGLPRTGTTLLHHLLTQDPQHRGPTIAEMWNPVTLPTPSSRDVDFRTIPAQRGTLNLNKFVPRNIHSSTGPEECLYILAHSFTSLLFPAMCSMPSYGRWLLQQDQVPAYRYYKLVVQLLQWQLPGGRWVFKAPGHLLALDVILALFPDCSFVWLHRDVHEAVASKLSLSSTVYRSLSDEPDLSDLHKQSLDMLEACALRGVHARDAAPANRFLDVQYNDLSRDPIGQVRRIYEHLDEELSTHVEAQMRAFLEQNPRGKHGTHAYSLEEFGVRPDEVDRRFTEYRERYMSA